SFHPYRRRAPHQQFPALGAGLYRALFHRRPVAGFHPGGTGRRHRLVRTAAAALRAHARPGRGARVLIAQRIATALVLMALVIAAVLLLPTRWFALVTSPFLLLGAWEWTRLAGIRGAFARAAYVLLVAFAALGTFAGG